MMAKLPADLIVNTDSLQRKHLQRDHKLRSEYKVTNKGFYRTPVQGQHGHWAIQRYRAFSYMKHNYLIITINQAFDRLKFDF